MSNSLINNYDNDEKKLNHQLIRNMCKKKAKYMTDCLIKIILFEITKKSCDVLDYRNIKLIRHRIFLY